MIYAIDSETYRIGPDAVTPKLVCYSVAWDVEGEIKSRLVTTADENAKPYFESLLEPGVHLVAHNGAFDFTVFCKFWPDLEPTIWAKYEREEIHDTMLREQLLNLSTIGKLDSFELPNGQTQRLSYTLAALVNKHLGYDISEDKEGDEVWRVNYDILDGLKSDAYPEDARQYALDDAVHTLEVYQIQDDLVESKYGYSSFDTETFHSYAAFALRWCTDVGMAIDPGEYYRVVEWLEEELSTEKLQPLVDAGIMRPGYPELPHKNKTKLAEKLYREWTGEEPNWPKLDPALRVALEDAGVKFKRGKKSSINKKALQIHALSLMIPDLPNDEWALDELEAIAEKEKIQIKRTATGQISVDSEVVAGLVRDPVMACYKHRQDLQKIVTTELPRITWNNEPARTVHFSYKTLVETGRTSSFASKLFPSANGQNVDPRVRPIYVPRPGNVLCSTDYQALELICVGQTMYDLFGESEHRNKINAGYDLHCYLGTHLASNLSPEFQDWTAGLDLESRYQFFKSLEKKQPEWYDHWRTFAKPSGLGFASGLGLLKFIDFALHTYEVDIQAMAVAQYEVDPGQFEIDGSVIWYAKKLHGMAKDEIRWTDQLKAISLAKRIREIWLGAYPEMLEYFEWVKAQKDGNTPILRTVITDEGEEDVEGLCYTTPMGMHRAACSYTATVNGRALQSPGAEGAKNAVIALQRACRDRSMDSMLFGCLFPNFIHDQCLVEFPEDAAMHERAAEVSRIMCDGMRVIATDVDVKAEPCLMRAWHKKAKPVYDEIGRLSIWEPAPAA